MQIPLSLGSLGYCPPSSQRPITTSSSGPIVAQPTKVSIIGVSNSAEQMTSNSTGTMHCNPPIAACGAGLGALAFLGATMTCPQPAIMGTHLMGVSAATGMGLCSKVPQPDKKSEHSTHSNS